MDRLLLKCSLMSCTVYRLEKFVYGVGCVCKPTYVYCKVKYVGQSLLNGADCIE